MEREIRSEARGAHWVAWVATGPGGPLDDVLVVGQTREEAEARARAWFQAREFVQETP